MVSMDRFEIPRDHALVARERSENTPHDVVKRHVVVPGHDEPREPEGLDEPACLCELRLAGPLGQIAGNRDQVRSNRVNRRQQRRDEPLIETAEVQIREVDDGPHGSACGHDDVQRAGSMR